MRYFIILVAAALLPPFPLRADNSAESGHNFRDGQYVYLVKDIATEGRLPNATEKTEMIPRGAQVQIIRVQPDRIAIRNGWKSEWVKPDAVVTQDEAIEYFTKAIQKTPTAKDYQIRAGLWFHKYQYDKAVPKAIADLEKAIQLDPNSPSPYFSRGRFRLFAGKFEVALNDFNTVIKNKTSKGNFLGNAYTRRGQTYEKLGEWAKALDDYHKAIQLLPSVSDLPRRVAWILATCPDEKFRNGEKSLKLAQESWRQGAHWYEQPQYAETVAAAYAEVGNFERAIKFIRSAMLIDPNDDETQRQNMLKAFKDNEPWRITPNP